MNPTTAITVASPSATVTTAARTVPDPRGPGCIARPVPVTTSGGAPAPVRSDTALLERRAARVGDRCRSLHSALAANRDATRTTTSTPIPRTVRSTSRPGSGSAIRASPIGKTGERATATMTAIPAAAVPMIAGLGHPQGEEVPAGPPEGAQRGVLPTLLHRLAGQDLTGDQDGHHADEGGRQVEGPHDGRHPPVGLHRVLRDRQGQNRLAVGQGLEAVEERRLAVGPVLELYHQDVDHAGVPVGRRGGGGHPEVRRGVIGRRGQASWLGHDADDPEVLEGRYEREIVERRAALVEGGEDQSQLFLGEEVEVDRAPHLEIEGLGGPEGGDHLVGIGGIGRAAGEVLEGRDVPAHPPRCIGHEVDGRGVDERAVLGPPRRREHRQRLGVGHAGERGHLIEVDRGEVERSGDAVDHQRSGGRRACRRSVRRRSRTGGLRPRGRGPTRPRGR